jgi:hypothetical protein
MQRYGYVLGLMTAASILMLTACDDQCHGLTDCASDQICYAGGCQNALNAQLVCQADIDVDTDKDGEIDIRGCNPESTDPNSRLQVICVAGRCRFAAGDPPVIISDAGLTDTGTVAGLDASTTSMDAAMMGPTDAAFVSPTTACAFPTLASNNEDTAAPTLIGSPTVNGMASTNSVASGAAFTVEFTVTEGCGIDSAQVVIGADPAGGTTNAPERIVLNLTEGNGIVNGGGASSNQSTVTVQGVINQCLRNTGQYKLLELHLRDYAGNTKYYEPDGNGVLQQADKKGDTLTNAGLPGATISVTGTGGTELPPPSVTSISAMVNGAGGIDVTAVVAAQDMSAAGCHLHQLHVTATSTRGQTLTAVSSTPIGTPAPGGALTATIDVPTCAQNGTWTISSVKIVDAALREVEYTTAGGNPYSRSGGQMTTIGAASVTLSGGTDQTSPDFDDIQVQTMIGATGTGVNFNFAVSDDVCLLSKSWVQLVHESGSPSFTKSLTEGNDTLSTGCLPIPICAKAGNYKLSTITANDKSMSSVTLSESGATYSVSKTDSSTLGWAPPSIVTFRHN